MQISPWIKNNARWWANGEINDSDFILSIQHLIKTGIIRITDMDQAQISYHLMAQ